MQFVKDIEQMEMKIVYLTGHSLVGSVILELLREFGSNTFPFEIRGIAYNPYLPKVLYNRY